MAQGEQDLVEDLKLAKKVKKKQKNWFFLEELTLHF